MMSLPSYGPTSDQEIQQQANVTVNLGRSPNCITAIKSRINSRGKGYFIDGPIDASTMMVDRQELVFVNTDGFHGQQNKVGYRSDYFTSFNGQLKDPNFTQKEFERGFKFIGVATSTQDFTGDMPNKHGFAAVTAGSISIKNISNTTFYPGDLVAWNAPNVEEKKRAEQYKSAAYGRLEGSVSSASKNVATLSRVTLKDIVSHWSDVARTLLSDLKKVSIYVVRKNILHNTLPEGLNDEDMAAVWLKQYTTLVMYQTLVDGVKHGIVEPIDQLKGNRRDNTYTDAIQDLQRNTWAGKRNLVFKQNLDIFARNLSQILGLVAPDNSGFDENTWFIDHVLQRVLSSNVDEIEDSGKFIDILTDEFTDKPQYTTNKFGNLSIDNPNVPLQLKLIKSDALRSLYQSIVSNAFSFTEKVIGTVSNTSPPGTQIHMVLSS